MSSLLDIDRSVSVSGPPGERRTGLLVKRIVATLESGVPPERIAILCPSERAADGLRERVRAELAETGDDSAAASLVCTTIASLARSLLALEALPARHAPGARLGPVEIPTGLLSSWSEGLSSSRPVLAALASHLGATDNLADAAQTLWAHRDLDVAASPLAFDAEAAHAELIIVRDVLESALGQCLAPDRSPLILGNRELREALGSWTLMSPPEGVLTALTVALGPTRDEGPGEHWAGDSRELALSTLDMIDAWRERWLQAAHGALIRALVFDLIPRLERHRHGRGATDAGDMLLRLARLLESDSAARTRLSARFDAWLVDDVDHGPRVQVRIIALLARPPEVEGTWTARPPRSGALFATGTMVSAHGRHLAELISRRGTSVTVEHDGAPGPAVWVDSRETLRDTVGRVAQEVADGTAARDILVVLPRWSEARRLRGALAQIGIRATVDGGPAPNSEPYRLLRSALRCLDDPAEAVALVHVLRGLFALSPGALALHSIEGGTWCYLDPEQPIGRVAQAFETLRELREDRRGSWLPTMHALLDVCGARAAWSQLVRGPGWLADVDDFLRRLEEAEERCPGPGAAVQELLRSERSQQPGEPTTDALVITSLERAQARSARVVLLVDGPVPPSPTDAVVHQGRLLLSLCPGLEPSGYASARAAALEHHRSSWSALIQNVVHMAKDRLVVIGSRDHPGDTHPFLAEVHARSTQLCDASIPVPDREQRAFGPQDELVTELLRTPSARRERATPRGSRPIRRLPVGGATRPEVGDQPVLESLELATESWLGVSFSVPGTDGLVQGVLDACFPVDPDRRRWVVIDWTAAPDESLRGELTECAQRALELLTPCRTVEVHMIGPEHAEPPLVR